MLFVWIEATIFQTQMTTNKKHDEASERERSEDESTKKGR